MQLKIGRKTQHNIKYNFNMEECVFIIYTM